MSIAILAHGSDLRDPDRHSAIDRWSPYRDETWGILTSLREGSARFRALIERVGAPVFVTTPDLLLDWPTAQWAPLVIDVDRWRSDSPVLLRSRPVVVHAPTNRMIKGTDLIEPVLDGLHREGAIEYRRLEAIRSEDMPLHFRGADIVIDQVRLGAYGSVSVEAMAAGRLTIAHVHDRTVESIRRITGETVPIVRATPEVLERRLRDVIDRPDRARVIAERGPAFVRTVHDGRLTAEVIAESFLREDRRRLSS